MNAFPTDKIRTTSTIFFLHTSIIMAKEQSLWWIINNFSLYFIAALRYVYKFSCYTRTHLNKVSVRRKNHKIKLNLRHHRSATLPMSREIFYTLCIRFASTKNDVKSILKCNITCLLKWEILSDECTSDICIQM